MKEIIVDSIETAVINLAARCAKYVGMGIINSSYWICLTACLIALIMYISGQKKAGKVVSISFIVYFCLQAIKGAFVK